MTQMRWRVRLGDLVVRDIADILEYTQENFGGYQAEIYKVTLTEALMELKLGPIAPGSRVRDEILPGLRTLHVARSGRRGRHIILYRVQSSDEIEVLRILYDGMDLSLHIPPIVKT